MCREICLLSRLFQILNMLMLHGAQLQRSQTSEIMEVVIRHREFRMVERLLELGVNPKLVTLEMGDTPLHTALSIALDKDKGWSCCLVYVEKGHTPLHAALDEENGQRHTPFTLLWSSPWTRRVVRCAVCVVYVEKGHMPFTLLWSSLWTRKMVRCAAFVLCVVYVERGGTLKSLWTCTL